MAKAAGESRGLTLIGHDDLSGRGNGGEGLGLVERGGRRVLYIAHESAPVNFTVVDVTDPRRPTVLAQTELPHRQVRSNSLSVSAEGDLLAVAYQVSQPGLSPAGFELFDISRPQSPVSVGFFDTSGANSYGAHFVWLNQGRAYLSTGLPDFQPSHPADHQLVVIVDVSDPSRPAEIGRWWLPGTRQGDAEAPPERHLKHDKGFRAHNVNVYPSRPDRAYVGYLDGGIVILDIADPSRPRAVSRLDYHPPLPGFTHTVLPLFSRDLLAVTDEALSDDCSDYPKKLWIVDSAWEPNLVPIATAPLPPTSEFCARGGRFGAHNVHENDPTPTAWHSESELIGAFFNAGVRIFDIADPFQPREVACFIPEPPARSPVGAAQMNDVYADEKGLIYAIDRYSGGLYILERR